MRRIRTPQAPARSSSSVSNTGRGHLPLVETTSNPAIPGGDITAYCLERVRATPGLSLRGLAAEVEKTHGHVIGRSTLRRRIQEFLETQPRLKRKRQRALRQNGFNTAPRKTELRNKLLELRKRREWQTLRRRFTEIERAIANGLVRTDPLKYEEIVRTIYPEGRKYGAQTIEHAIVRLLAKLKHWEETGKWRKEVQPYPGKAVRRIRKILDDLRAAGRTMDRIEEEATLNATECRVLRLYVLAAEPISLQEAADQAGQARKSMVYRMRKIEAKLKGEHPEERYRQKYRKMGDTELETEIRKTGATSKAELQKKNRTLAFVARERGILERIFQKTQEPDPEVMKAMRRIVAEGGLEDLLAELPSLQKAVLFQRLLSRTPSIRPAIAREFGVTTGAVLCAERSILHTLRGERKWDRPLRELRRMVRAYGPEMMDGIKSKLDARERLLIETQGEAEYPKTLKALGIEMGVTRERMRQIRATLVEKMKGTHSPIFQE